ncbi:winged-helix domain-containing protein [Verrucomicrobium spinosum]|uniref:winged-helix domain-containing protein n=1 Tax=Verrucomicrobium spinosum TaxID=2736 RepID=UPI000A9E4A35|nr:winged-helix domain-containing protein [Verrucomicrobium spinosum]
MTRIEIPRKTVYRLSIYQRCLQKLKDNMMETVSSEALAKAAGVKSTQLRKDLTYFGQFGTRGLGYNVAGLSGAIGEVLGRSRLQPSFWWGLGIWVRRCSATADSRRRVSRSFPRSTSDPIPSG